MIYTVNESASKVVKKNTNFADILFESEQNNMMIFEAALACDFHEIKGLREGTIVSSELSALQEKTAKEYMGIVWTAIKRAWEKILEALGNAMKTIGLFVLKTGTPLTKKFDETYDAHKREGIKFNDLKTEWIDMDKLSDKYSVHGVFNKGMSMMDQYAGYKYANGDKATAHNISSSIFCEYLGVTVGTVEAPKEFIEEAMKKSIETKDIKNKSDLEPMLDILRKNDAIKALRKTESELGKELNEVKKALDKNPENNADAIGAVASAYQTAINAFTNLHIKSVRFDMKKAYTVIQKAIMDIEGVKESVDYAVSVFESEFDADMETVPGQEEIDPQFGDAVNALIDASEPEADPNPEA